MDKLPFKDSLLEAVQIGAKNFLSLVLVTILYVLTIWIPYINVGTTIAIEAIPALLAKGEVIDPLFIFDEKYRKNMGEFFILIGLMMMALIPAFCLLFAPGMVLSMAWSLAILLFIDKDMKALDALRKSNELTYGYKWRIFFLVLVLVLVMQLIASILGGIFKAVDMPVVGGFVASIASFLLVPFRLGLDAVIYRNLTAEPKVEEPKAEEPKADAEEPKANAEEPKADVVVEGQSTDEAFNTL